MLSESTRAGVVEIARAAPAVVALYIFGSRANGTAAAASDLDLAVLADRPLELAALVDLQQRFQDVAAFRVDVVDLRSAEAYLALDVVRGDRVYCRHEETADEFELFVMRRAGDLEPFVRERRRLLATTPLASTPARG
jgi:predicted nucleotidyltransferase